jgi:hypothetical protein
MTKTIIAIAAAFSLTAGPSFGQQARDDRPLQQLLSDLRACVRSNAAEVYALGIRATRDAEKHLLNRCGKTVLNEFFVSTVLNGGTPLPPGILRKTAREEWAAFLNAAGGR